jgi:hypothetical protein
MHQNPPLPWLTMAQSWHTQSEFVTISTGPKETRILVDGNGPLAEVRCVTLFGGRFVECGVGSFGLSKRALDGWHLENDEPIS